MMYISAALLPCAYIVGMIFTFKTHSHIFHQESDDSNEGAFSLLRFFLPSLVHSINTLDVTVAVVGDMCGLRTCLGLVVPVRCSVPSNYSLFMVSFCVDMMLS